jgi:hypothetical protein
MKIFFVETFFSPFLARQVRGRTTISFAQDPYVNVLQDHGSLKKQQQGPVHLPWGSHKMNERHDFTLPADKTRFFTELSFSLIIQV